MLCRRLHIHPARMLRKLFKASGYIAAYEAAVVGALFTKLNTLSGTHAVNIEAYDILWRLYASTIGAAAGEARKFH